MAVTQSRPAKAKTKDEKKYLPERQSQAQRWGVRQPARGLPDPEPQAQPSSCLLAPELSRAGPEGTPRVCASGLTDQLPFLSHAQ